MLQGAQTLGMKIAVISPYMTPEAGGMLGAVRALSATLASSHCEVQVFGPEGCRDADFAEWSPARLRLLELAGPRSFAFQPRLQDELRHFDPDLVHVHGLWMYPTVAAKRWGRSGRPYLVSTHGMLDQWALGQSRWKKRIASIVYERRSINSAQCVNALNSSEYKSIRQFGISAPVAVIPNGVSIPIAHHTEPHDVLPETIPRGAKIALFMGRIHAKKGVHELLNGWQQLKGAEDWHLVLAGWDEMGLLNKYAGEGDAKARIHYIGPQLGSAKHAIFSAARAFILPSFSEGAPMAILEAWSYGLPVLMTQECNLESGFAHGAAIRIRPDPSSVAEGLHDLVSMPEKQREAMGQRGLRLVKEQFSWEKSAHQTAAVYHWIQSGGSAPECVRLN